MFIRQQTQSRGLVRNAPEQTAPPANHQGQGPSRDVERGTGAHLPVGVLVSVVVPGVVIVLDERKVFFLLSLERGWSSLHVGRKVTLGERKNKNKK